MTEEEKFTQYASHYNPSDSQIRLKIVHTWRVVAAADAIAEDLDLSEQQRREVHLAALYHDIGRFEQVRRFHTFTDSRSIPHARLSAQVLREGDFLTDLDEAARKRVLRAIEMHSDFALPEEDTGWQKTLDAILRDADKIDIFRVAALENPADTIDPQMVQSKDGISEKVESAIFAHRSVVRSDRRTLLDFWISFLGFLFDLNLPVSFEMVQQQGWWKQPIEAWLADHPDADPVLRKRLNAIVQECRDYIEAKKQR